MLFNYNTIKTTTNNAVALKKYPFSIITIPQIMEIFKSCTALNAVVLHI